MNQTAWHYQKTEDMPMSYQVMTMQLAGLNEMQVRVN